MASTDQLPENMRALVVHSTSEPPTIKTVPVPKPSLGNAVVRMSAANVVSYARDIYSGKRRYPFPMPFVPGSSGIGRVAATGKDSTRLQPGDLVLVDPYIRSRDDPTDQCLAGLHEGFTSGSQKLMRDVVRDWTYAEYVLVPLENIAVLDERKLTGPPGQGGLGYTVEQLCYLEALLVPYGGFKDMGLQPGQTIIVAPATGPFGGAAVLVAQAMGAKVIAMGRNKSSLEGLKKKVPYPNRLEIVPITGDMMADSAELQKHGPIDAYFDIGPPEAAKSSHIKSSIFALRWGARVCFMGGYQEDIAFPHFFMMHKSMKVNLKWMYERSDIADMIQMVQNGVLDLSKVDIAGEYALDEWKDAWDAAAEKAGFGRIVVVKP